MRVSAVVVYYLALKPNDLCIHHDDHRQDLIIGRLSNILLFLQYHFKHPTQCQRGLAIHNNYNILLQIFDRPSANSQQTAVANTLENNLRLG